MKEAWLFLQYTSDSKKVYPKFPFEIKLFFDFDEMKTYSANQSAIYKNRKDSFYPDYCSNYVKIEL